MAWKPGWYFAGAVAMAGAIVSPPASAFAPLAGVTQVSAGHEFACAVAANGALKCWGEGFSAGLGIGSREPRSSPIEAIGLSAGATGVAAGSFHTCAVTSGGGVRCWGANAFGQLGDGTTTDRLVPVDVAGLADVAAVAVGDTFSCALTTGGGVKCWGSNAFGQLGDGSGSNRPSPGDVSGLATGVIALSARGANACAVLAGGTARCWGGNAFGQLGDGSLSNRPTPVDVSGLAGVTAISSGYRHTCAVASGAVKCWGDNTTGQLGDGTNAQRTTPVDVTGLAAGATAVAGGNEHSCAVVGGAVKCWGANGYGELGDGTFVASLAPVNTVGAESGITAVTASHRLSCALGAGGALACWGDNGAGQLGVGSFGVNAPFLRPTRRNATPIDVAGLGAPAATIHPGNGSTCAVTTGGALKCWGANVNGQLGDGTTSLRYRPVDVTGLTSGVGSAGTGSFQSAFSCALTTGGGVMCWGDNGNGQLGDGTTTPRSVPADVSGLASGVSDLAVGGANACVITTGGAVKCWGRGGSNGDGTTTQRAAPVDASGLGAGVARVAAGSQHACALTAGGGVKCWGLNSSGQVGIGLVPAQQLVPADVPGLASGIQAIAAGGNGSCVLTAGGAVKCWGDNTSGQVGDGAMGGGRPTPTDVAGLSSGVSAIAVGGAHACALLAGGGVKCWGDNDFGQLGSENAGNTASPVDVAGLASGAVAIAAGNKYTCAVLAGGVAKCWGHDGTAQLGNGVTDRRPFAAEVMQGDIAPDAFAFASQAGVALSSTRTSNAVAIAGIEVPTGISVANGEYSVGCTGTFTALPGILPPGGTVCVRHVSSATRGGAAVTTLTIGGVDGTFTSTTSATASGVALAGPASSVAGTAITLTATVTGASPTGSVTFKDGAAALAGCTAVALVAGVAGCVADTLAPGPHSLVAEYGGDANHDAAVSAPLAHLVTAPNRLVNLSTRMRVLTGDNVMIGGFIIGGGQPKTVVVRGRGPSLAQQGVAQPLANPRVDLYSGQAVIASNDDWGSAPNAAQIVTSGYSPVNIYESAILATLAPGAYTAIVSGADGGTGVGIVEVFEVDGITSPLVNIATRGFVQAGQDVMIGGFAIQGNSPKSVILRARGPSLAASGIANPLANPLIQVYSGNTLIAENDDWASGANAAQIQAAGFAPSNASEAALLLSLPPGLYTVIVSGVGGTSGVAIVEVFAQ